MKIEAIPRRQIGGNKIVSAELSHRSSNDLAKPARRDEAMRSSTLAVVTAVSMCTVAIARASETCIASVYSDGFNRVLADGKHHSVDELLVAHRKLPFGTIVNITLIATGATVRAVVRDRGPFVPNRCLDLSLGAARALGLSSIGRVKFEQVVATGQEASAK